MKQFGVFDIESRNWTDFEVLGFYDGAEYRVFESLTGFLDHLRQKRFDGMRIFAHNGGKFDFLFLLEPLLRRKWIRDIIERGGRIIALKVDTGKSRFLFSDSYALLPQSLAKLSEGFEVEHKKGTIDYDKISKRSKETLEYLKQDCLALHEILTKFFASEYVVNPRLTIAAQALDTFRNRFCPSTIATEELLEEQYIRDNFYHGGRVEVFKGFGTGLNGYDVNSLFPFAMLSEMPLGIPRHVSTWEPGRIGFYDVQVLSAPTWYIPPFTVKQDKKLLFTNGPGRYYLSSQTIAYLKKEYGVRFRVNHGLVFPKAKSIFTEYVETFYRIKQTQKGGPLYIISKLMLNSLYGKFGMARYRETVKLDTGQFDNFLQCDALLDSYGYVLVPEKSRSRFIMPYIAAWITDTARLYHWRLMQEHGEDSIFYCDTDSFYTDKPLTGAFARKYLGKRLGQLSQTCERVTGVFVSPKCYALKERNGSTHVMFKGFNGSDFSFQDMLQAAHGRELTQVRDRVLGYREAINRKAPVKHQSGKFLKLAETEKTAKVTYDKRLTFADDIHIFETQAQTRAALP